MFKKKSLHLEFSDHSGYCLLLSVSLIFFLYSETAYPVPPVKPSSSYAILSGETPELPDTEELGATGTTIPDITGLDNPAFEANDSGTGEFLTLSFSQLSVSAYSNLFLPNSATHAPLPEQVSMLPGTEPGAWLDHFSMLLSELNNEPGYGINDTFPAPEFISQSLQQVELNNVYLNDPVLNNILLSNALHSIVTTPENYTVMDIYYVLWLMAKYNNEQSLMKVLSLNALILKRHLNLGKIKFHQLADDVAREVLFDSLARLRKALNQPGFNVGVAVIMTRFIFNDLYHYVHSKATDALELELASQGTRAGLILTFLYELDQISSQLFDGKDYVESNNLAYARSRAWYFLFDKFGHRDRSPQQSRNLHSAYISLTALYCSFIGKPDMAYRMLEELARTVPGFARENDTHDVHSIVRWVINGNLLMFDPSEYDKIVQALFLMARNPFPSSSSQHTPNTIILAGNLDILRALRKELSLVYSQWFHVLNIGPPLSYQIETSEVFEVTALANTIERQNKAQQEQDKKKPGWFKKLQQRNTSLQTH
ncbi:hypothetical protein [Endozoicomonas sp. 4G]|uniref:hypothetical protein n=1 Tax=Endozoicomonas sp. 4G TaxID=2872754 RepID=UPI0020785651|nr:hypothetical protein [Endozoicomonas sp. 4G]